MFNSNQLPSYLKDYQIFNNKYDGRSDNDDSNSQESDHSDEEEDDDDDDDDDVN